MNHEIFPKVKFIINKAMEEAKNFDDIKMRPEHIILSILTDNDNECLEILKKLNVDICDLQDKITDYLKKTDLIPRISQSKLVKLPFSDETKKILKTLEKECDSMNDKIINLVHIMLAILAHQTPTTKIFSEFNVTYNNFKKTIMEEKNGLNYDFNDEFPEEQERFKRTKKKNETSKTPVLDNFCRDISKAVENGNFEPVIGREKEIKRISQILSRRKKNNPVLIGEPGVGKCISPDTIVVIRNDLTNEIIKVSINEFLKLLPTPNNLFSQ